MVTSGSTTGVYQARSFVTKGWAWSGKALSTPVYTMAVVSKPRESRMTRALQNPTLTREVAVVHGGALLRLVGFGAGCGQASSYREAHEGSSMPTTTPEQLHFSPSSGLNCSVE